MTNLTRRRWLEGLLATAAWCAWPAAANARGDAPKLPRFGRNTLFVITRSKNDNTVYYDAKLNPAGQLVSDEPLSVYWRMFAENGQREGLTWLERSAAYGYELTRAATDNGAMVRLSAFPERLLRLQKNEQGYVAATRIGKHEEALLKHIHVQSSDGLLGPTVHCVDLYGVAPGSGKTVHERVRPS